MGVLLYAALLAHLVAYKENYTNIGLTFAATVIARILVKKTGDIDNATLVNLGGSALTVEQAAILLKKVTTLGFDGTTNPLSPSGKGIISDSFHTIYTPIIEMVKDMLDKK